MSSTRTRSSPGHYRMLLDPQALRDLLETLKSAGVVSFNYEDAKVKLEIVRGPARAVDGSDDSDNARG